VSGHVTGVKAFFGTLLLAASLQQTACGSSSSNDQPMAPLTSGTGGAVAGRESAGGSVGTTGGISGTGGSVVVARGGASSGGSASSRGGTSSGGSAGTPSEVIASSGVGGMLRPPPATASGDSPYLAECHGDTAMCGDVVNLRCLGLRDASVVYGYSCSNECGSDADCSTAPSHVEAAAGCVDFTTSKHCLLVCKDGATTRGCPSGMTCKSYPGASIGYCLWP
jgi:hypothetical protein